MTVKTVCDIKRIIYTEDVKSEELLRAIYS